MPCCMPGNVGIRSRRRRRVWAAVVTIRDPPTLTFLVVIVALQKGF